MTVAAAPAKVPTNVVRLLLLLRNTSGEGRKAVGLFVVASGASLGTTEPRPLAASLRARLRTNLDYSLVEQLANALEESKSLGQISANIRRAGSVARPAVRSRLWLDRRRPVTSSCQIATRTGNRSAAIVMRPAALAASSLVL